jgi:hypothetical protein
MHTMTDYTEGLVIGHNPLQSDSSMSDIYYIVNLPSFLPAVMTSSSSSVDVVMSCHVREASLLSS